LAKGMALGGGEPPHGHTGKQHPPNKPQPGGTEGQKICPPEGDPAQSKRGPKKNWKATAGLVASGTGGEKDLGWGKREKNNGGTEKTKKAHQRELFWQSRQSKGHRTWSSETDLNQHLPTDSSGWIEIQAGQKNKTTDGYFCVCCVLNGQGANKRRQPRHEATFKSQPRRQGHP